MASPYRQIEQSPPPDAKSSELVYRPRERNDRMAAGHSAFRLVVLPTLVALVIGNLWSVEMGVVAFVALLVALVLWSRRRPKDVMVLRISGGELHVLPMGSDREAFRVRLDELDDIVLETKSVQRVLDGGANAVNIGMGQVTPAIGPAADTNRIVLESSREAHALTSEFFGHAETTEWFAKVRRFLRSAGWTPLSERGEDAIAGESDDDDASDDDIARSASG